MAIGEKIKSSNKAKEDVRETVNLILKKDAIYYHLNAQ